MDPATRARYRIEPILADIAATAGIPTPRLHVTRFGDGAQVGIDQVDGHIYITYPAKRAAHQTDTEIRGVLAHETAHITLGHVRPETVPRWMRSERRMGACVAVALICGIVLVVLFGLVFGIPWLQLQDGSGLNPIPVWLGGLVGGIPLAAYAWTRKAPARPGWDGTTSRHRELAADVAAVQLVGRDSVLAATASRLPRTSIGRWGERMADGPFARIATHPSTELRLAVVGVYRGEDPKEYAKHALNS